MPRQSNRVGRSIPTARASVSFPADIYAELEQLAMAKKVSLAWVIREAAERYIAAQWPLLAPPRDERHQ